MRLRQSRKARIHMQNMDIFQDPHAEERRKARLEA
jgi:hypothetical protein